MYPPVLFPSLLKDTLCTQVQKAALESVVEIAAMELGKRGITVNSVAPGVTETDMSHEVLTPEFI